MQTDRQPMKIGVALGSGAMRGLAHIGVLQVFMERGIAVDLVAGTSIGSVIGAFFCCGDDMKLIGKLFETLDERKYLDFIPPRQGFVKGDQIQLLVKTLTHDCDFADLKVPLNIIACDLDNNCAAVLDSGKVHEAVRGSISIPGVFVPHVYQGMRLVDGGVIDRVPVTQVHRMGADFTIGVDVGYRGTPSKADSLLEIIYHAYELMDWELTQQKTQNADFTITPELTDVDPTSLTDAHKAIERGREAALAALPELEEKMAQRQRELAGPAEQALELPGQAAQEE